MREILFRGKRKDNGEWIEGDLYAKRNHANPEKQTINIKNSPMFDYEVHPSTVRQYTGLKDQNGNKIFEGDIVKRESMAPGGIDFIGTVIFREGIYLLGNEKDCIPLFTEIDTLEVLGNINDKEVIE